MQLQVNQPDLAQMFGQDSLYNTLYGLQRQDQANANQAQNLSQAQQEQQFQAQDQPINLQQLAANVGHTNALAGLTNAQIPGVQAESRLKTNAANADDSVDSVTRNQKALSAYAASINENDLKAHEAQANADLYSGDPQKVANARMVLENTPAIRAKLREIAAEGSNSARVAGINQAGSLAVNKENNDAGRYNKNSTESLLLKQEGGTFMQQAGAASIRMQAALASAKAETDPQSKQDLLDIAAAAKKRYDEAVLNDYRSKQAGPQAGNASKLNIAPMVGGQNVVDPSSLPTPPVQQPVADTSSPTKLPPKAGAVIQHGGSTYRFKGGDPSNQSNWEKL